MKYKGRIYLFLSLCVFLLLSNNSLGQDSVGRHSTIAYGIPLAFSCSFENYNELRTNMPYYINTPSDDNIMLNSGFYVGNPQGLNASADIGFNWYEKKGMYGGYYNIKATIMRLAADGAVYYNLIHVGPRYNISPFLGESFREDLLYSTDANLPKGNWLENYEVVQTWLIHCGIMVEYLLKEPTHVSIFVKVGYDIPATGSTWYNYVWQSVANMPTVSLGGPFITVGLIAWNK